MGWVGGGGGGQGGCESRIEVFWKIQKRNWGGVRRVGPWGGGVRVRGQDGCEQRIEVFVKIKKKKNFVGGRGGGGGGGGLGWVGGSGWM